MIGDTDFGFRFGPALVERAMSLPDGLVVVRVQTDAGRAIDIYVSRTGKSVRVFEKGRGELTARGRSV